MSKRPVHPFPTTSPWDQSLLPPFYYTSTGCISTSSSPFYTSTGYDAKYSVLTRRVDDGTVVGLTRAEMDASLLTLEHMASEVGGTVLVLKEIVLEARHRNIPSSKCARSGPDAKDADNAGMSGEGRSSWGRGGKKYRSKRRDLRRSAWFDQKMRENERGEAESHSPKTLREYGDYTLDLTKSAESNDASRLYPSTTSPPSGGGTPFQLELEGPNSTVIPVVSPPGSRWRSKRPSARRETPEQRTEREAKSEEKLRKRAAKREERRMSLLRGDGLGVGVESTLVQSTSSHCSDTASSIGASESSSQQDLQDIQDVTHQLSSLRLPPPLARSAHDPRIEDGLSSTQHERRGIDADSEPDFFGELLHTPLDSLSLSFADVRTIRATDSGGSDSEPPSPDWADISGPPDSAYGVGAKSPEIQNGGHRLDGHSADPRRSVSTMPPVDSVTTDHCGALSNPESELICVEALVVRKPLFDSSGYGLAPDEDEVEWGGEEDGWGLGGNDVWGLE